MRMTLGQAADVRLGRQRSPEHEVGNHPTRYLRSANVVDGALDLSDVKTMNFTPAERQIFSLVDGDVLVTEGSGSIGTVGTSAVWREDLSGVVCFQNTLLRLRPRTGVTSGRFLAWWARHARASGQIIAISSGANIKHVGSDGLKRLRLEVPAVDEQRRIADFLEDRVARIDRMITARRKQVALLESARLSMLYRATDGPADDNTWTNPRISHVFRTGSGTTPPSDRLDCYDGGVAWVNTGDVRDAPLPATAKTVSAAALAEFSPLVSYPENSLVVAMYGQGATKGRVALLEISACVNQACCVLTGDTKYTRWAFHWFRAHKRQIVELANGAGQPNLSQEILRSVRIALPPSFQIDQLLVEITEAENRLRQLLRVNSLQAEKFSEYKQALITAAVTGELDVTTAGSGIPG